jgi:hypothetical protein
MKIRLFTSILLVGSFILISCRDSQHVQEELLTEEEIKIEKQAIVDLLKAYHDAANEKSWAKMVITLDKEVTFFGSDSGEVSRNFDDFKKSMQKQWDEYETFEYGQIQDIYIQLDDYARYANVIYGIPLKFGKKGEPLQHFFMVVQRTLKKTPVHKNWVIQSGILAVSRHDNTSASAKPDKKDKK